MNELPRKNLSKSQLRVTMDTDSLDSLILSNPLLVQNEEM